MLVSKVFFELSLQESADRVSQFHTSNFKVFKYPLVEFSTDYCMYKSLTIQINFHSWNQTNMRSNFGEKVAFVF